MNHLPLVVAFATPLCLLPAQSPLSGFAQGVVVTDTLAPSAPRTVIQKPAGDMVLTPFVAVDPAAPTYTVEALLHHLGAGASSAAAHLSMSAISTGNDVLPLVAGPFTGDEPDYYVVTTGGFWAAIALSFTEAALPDPTDPGSAFALRYAAHPGAGIGIDLFSYWFDSNVGLPPNLIDTAHFELGREHTGADLNEQVTGLDTYMPAVVEARGIPTNVVQIVDQWYFALTPGSAQYISANANWGTFDPAFSCAKAEIGANYVYQAHWSNGQWSEISVLFTPEDLGLTEGGDIDAIAFYRGQNSQDHIVFSLTGESSAGREQILVGGPDIRGPGMPGNKPVRAGDGGDIRIKIGARNDTDVDAICTYDPDAQDAYGYWLALPVENRTPVGIGSSVARYRTYDDNGNLTGEELLLQVTGLPTPSGQAGWAVSFDGAPPMLVRKNTSGDRAQTTLPLLPGQAIDEIVVVAAYVSGNTGWRSWGLKLLQ
ncbi:MAG: hypothetical protein KDE27_12605 [Planctomycetes bacterium]|nr:hypothetical protein [Planctomycetota bacterium]